MANKKNNKNKEKDNKRVYVLALVIICAIIVGITTGKLLYDFVNKDAKPVTSTKNVAYNMM